MNSYRLFQKGEAIQIINEGNPLYGEIGEIDHIEINGRYFVKLAGGHGISLFFHDIGPWLGYKQEKNYTRHNLCKCNYLLSIRKIVIGLMS